MSGLSRRVVIGAALAAPWSAQAAPKPSQDPRPTVFPGPDLSLVYLYIPDIDYLNGYFFDIYLDGVKLVQLTNRQYTWLYRKPGVMSLVVKMPFFFEINQITFNPIVAGGEISYLRLRTELRGKYIYGVFEAVSKVEAMRDLRTSMYEKLVKGWTTGAE